MIPYPDNGNLNQVPEQQYTEPIFLQLQRQQKEQPQHVCLVLLPFPSQVKEIGELMHSRQLAHAVEIL